MRLPTSPDRTTPIPAARPGETRFAPLQGCRRQRLDEQATRQPMLRSALFCKGRGHRLRVPCTSLGARGASLARGARRDGPSRAVAFYEKVVALLWPFNAESGLTCAMRRIAQTLPESCPPFCHNKKLADVSV